MTDLSYEPETGQFPDGDVLAFGRNDKPDQMVGTPFVLDADPEVWRYPFYWRAVYVDGIGWKVELRNGDVEGGFTVEDHSLQDLEGGGGLYKLRGPDRTLLYVRYAPVQ